MNEQDKAEIRIEESVGNLFAALYNIERVFGPKRKFEEMGIIIDMLSEARMDMIRVGKISFP